MTIAVAGIDESSLSGKAMTALRGLIEALDARQQVLESDMKRQPDYFAVLGAMSDLNAVLTQRLQELDDECKRQRADMDAMMRNPAMRLGVALQRLWAWITQPIH